MSPAAATFLAVAAFGALCGLVGAAAGRRWARRAAAWGRVELLRRVADLAAALIAAERERDRLATQAATFPERLQAAYDAGLAAAHGVAADGPHQVTVGGAWPLPDAMLLPWPKWVALREAQESWMEN